MKTTSCLQFKRQLLFIFFLFNSIQFADSSLHLVKPNENKMTVVQGKLKSIPIICVYVTYVTISLMYDCMFFNNLQNTIKCFAALFYQIK